METTENNVSPAIDVATQPKRPDPSQADLDVMEREVIALMNAWNDRGVADVQQSSEFLFMLALQFLCSAGAHFGHAVMHMAARWSKCGGAL